MKHFVFIIVICLAMFSACRIDKPENGVNLTGKINDLPNIVLYIESNDPELPFLDSITVKDGKFIYQHNKLNQSIIVKLYFFDSDKKKKTLCYVDPLKNTNVYTQLILENGKISLSGKSYKKIILLAPNENRLFLKFNQEGTVVNYNIYNPDGVIKDNQVIKDNSKSTYLLRHLYAQKVSMELTELKKQYYLFDKSLYSTIIGQKIGNYILSKEKVAKEIIDDSYKFNDTTGNLINLQSQLSKKRINLYIFWASWCVPCREEIPQLKKFNAKYQNEVNIISLSIDSDFQNWKKAVEQEKMPWLNVASLPNNPKFLKDKFFINSVPRLMLISISGEKLLSVGNNLDSIENYILTNKMIN